MKTSARSSKDQAAMIERTEELLCVAKGLFLPTEPKNTTVGELLLLCGRYLNCTVGNVP